MNGRKIFPILSPVQSPSLFILPFIFLPQDSPPMTSGWRTLSKETTFTLMENWQDSLILLIYPFMRLSALAVFYCTGLAFAEIPNLLINSGFEAGLSPWQAFNGGAATVVTSAAFLGNACGQSSNCTATSQELRQSFSLLLSPAGSISVLSGSAPAAAHR